MNCETNAILISKEAGKMRLFINPKHYKQNLFKLHDYHDVA